MILRTLRFLGAMTLLGAASVLRAQDLTCEAGKALEITKLSFTGNHQFDDTYLGLGITTEASSFAKRWFRFFGTKRCFNEFALAEDMIRLRYLYKRSGFVDARIDTVLKRSTDKVHVTFTIQEGRPVIIDSLTITGLDSVPERKTILSNLNLRVGDRFDEFEIQRAKDTLTARLRNSGYPAAEVLAQTETDTAYHGRVALEVTPSTRAWLAPLDISVIPRQGVDQQIPVPVVERLLGVGEGDLYREEKLQRAKRNLLAIGVYQTVNIEIDSADINPPGDSLATIHVRVSEGFSRTAFLKGGWGEIDCFRAEGAFTDNNVLHSARRIDFRGSVSKIGIGRPLSGASALCPRARRDPYSAKLNLYGGATFSEPTLAFIGLKPSLTLFAERRSEYLAFVRTTPLGLSFRGTRFSLTTRRAQDLGFQGEYGRTEAQPAVFCALRNACTPEDREPLLAYRWRTFAFWSTSQNWSNDPQYPTRGGLATLEFRHASKFTGSDPLLRFSKATFDARLYIPITASTVLAPRLRMGVVAAQQGSSIPVEERMYAGGGGSVRGFPANELGPTIYIARGFDTVRAPGATGEITPAESVFFRVRAGATAQRPVPTGGSALIVANLEVRQRMSRYIQGSMFVDAGETWNPNAARAEDRYSGLKITPGIGARYASLIGAVGVDVAYNRYGPRPGAIYFDTPIALGGQLFCVSPDNTLAITGLGGNTQPVQAAGACPATFRPPDSRSFWSRLQLTLSIGQSF